MVRSIIAALVLWFSLGLAQAVPIHGVLTTQVNGGLLNEGSSWNGRGNFIQYAATEWRGRWLYEYSFSLRSEDVSSVTLGFAGGYADPVMTHASVLFGPSGVVGEWGSSMLLGDPSVSGVRFDFEPGDLFRFGGASYGIITITALAAPVWGDVLFLGDQGSLAYNARFGEVIDVPYGSGPVWGKVPVPGELVSSVPEPNSALMALSGLGLLGFSLRKRLQT